MARDYYADRHHTVISIGQSVEYPHTLYHYKPSTHCMVAIERPEGRCFLTAYDNHNRVSHQQAPVGPNGELCTIAKYNYLTRVLLKK
jgi:hypothetical protein